MHFDSLRILIYHSVKKKNDMTFRVDSLKNRSENKFMINVSSIMIFRILDKYNNSKF